MANLFGIRKASAQKEYRRAPSGFLPRDGRRLRFGIEPIGEDRFRIAAVQTDKGFVSSFQFDEFEGPEEARDAMARLKYRKGLPTVLALPRRQAILRWIRLPVTEAADLAQMVPHEARILAPWPEAEGAFSYRAYASGTEGYSSVLIVLVRKSVLEDYLGRLHNLGIAPTRVEVSTLSLGRLLRETPADERIAIARSGPSGLEFARYRDTAPVFSRGMDQGETLPDLVTGSLALDERKHGPEERCTSLVLAGDGIEEAREEIQRRLPGTRVLSLEEFHLPVLNGVDGLHSHEMACVGAAMGGVAGEATENLLPAPEQLKLATRTLLRTGAQFAALAAVLVTLAVLLGLHYFAEERDYAQATRQRIEALRNQVGDLDVQSTQLGLLKSELTAISLPLEVVLELYDRTPDNIALNKFHFDARGSLNLGGEASSFDAVHNYLETLNKSPVFSDIELRSSAKSQNSASEFVDFRLDARIRGAGDRR